MVDYFIGNKINLRNIIIKIPLFVIALIFCFINLYVASVGNNINSKNILFNLSDRLFLSSYSFIYYLFNCIFPSGLCAFHNFPSKIAGYLPFKFYIAPVIIIVIILLLIYIWSAKKYRKEIYFGFLFFVFNIILVIQIVPIRASLVSERYSYISYMGIFYIIAFFASELICHPLKYSKPIRIICISGIIFYTLFSSFIIQKRIKVWNNDKAFYNDMIEKNKNSYLAYKYKGITRMKYNDFFGAVNDLNMSIKLNDHYSVSYLFRGIAHINLKDYNDALFDLNTAISLDKSYYEAYLNRAKLFSILNDFSDASKDYASALSLNPDNPEIYNLKGLSEKNNRDFNGAYYDFTKVISLSTDHNSLSSAYNNRGSLLASFNQYDNAKTDFLKAIYFNKKNPEAFFNLGFLEFKVNNSDNACKYWLTSYNLGYVKAKDFLNKYCK